MKPMRLDRFISEALGMSRKEATLLLRRGEILVDGSINKKGATQLQEDSLVEWQGQPLKLHGPLYFMMYKPVGYVCANSDGLHPTVFDLLRRHFPDLATDSCHTVGRLDKDTTGLLLVTNDGQWSHRISTPKNEWKKIYRAQLAEPLTEEAERAFAQGILLRQETELTAPAQLKALGPTEALVTLHEGRYHQVKRMFAAIGNKVLRLHREQIGSLTLDPTLKVGESRLLSAQEVESFN